MDANGYGCVCECLGFFLPLNIFIIIFIFNQIQSNEMFSVYITSA